MCGCSSADSKASVLDIETVELIRSGHLAIPEHNLGLKNYGSNCYVNAVLQSLMATGSLIAYLHRHLHDHNKEAKTCGASTIQTFCALCALWWLREAHISANDSDGSAHDEFALSVSSEFELMKVARRQRCGWVGLAVAFVFLQ